MVSKSVYVSTTLPEGSQRIGGGELVQQTGYAWPQLVQPNFYCGQLLTDQDLKVLRDWARDKRRLERYKQGWGVVRGLQVRCDPANPSGVIVGPGYAVDPQGNDIVVCKDSPVDLAKACGMPETICELPTVTALEQAPPDFLGIPLPLVGDPKVIDIFIRYDEKSTMPLPALGRGACSERDACGFSRIEEGYILEWKECVDPAKDPVDGALKAWEQTYFKQSQKIVDDFVSRFPQRNDLKPIQDWLRQQYPLHEFCFLSDAIDQLSTNNMEDNLRRILFWLVQDWRNDYLARTPELNIPNRVPLARIRLQPLQRKNDTVCRVLHIDPFPPTRRYLQPDRWPAPLGQFNLGQLIWQREEVVCSVLRQLGIQFTLDNEFHLPDTVDNLQQMLRNHSNSHTLFVGLSCISKPPLIAYSYQAGEIGSRVVTFARTAVT